MSNNTADLKPSAAAQIAQGLDLYAPPILTIIGATCNLLVILVMRASFFARVSTSLYISVNACLDNVGLVVLLPVHWIAVNFPEIIYKGSHSDVICKVLHFIGWSTSDLGVVLTAAMTSERAFAIKFPLKAPRYCTRKKAKYVIACLLLFVIFKDGHFIVKSQLMRADDAPELCELNTEDEAFSYYALKFSPVFHNIVLLISFVVIIGSNVIIIKCVKDSGSFGSYTSESVKVQSITGTGNANNQSTTKRSKKLSSGRGRQLTIMLISDSITVIVCTLPFALLNVLRPHVTFGSDDVANMTFSITFYLLYVNRCANFFLYCISGKKFRLGLEQLFARRYSGQLSTSVYTIPIGESIRSETNVSRRHSRIVNSDYSV